MLLRLSNAGREVPFLKVRIGLWYSMEHLPQVDLGTWSSLLGAQSTCVWRKKKKRVCHPQLAELLLNLPRNPSAEKLGTHFTTGILDETISSIENHRKILSKCAENPGQKNIVILKPRPGQVKIRSVHSDQTSWSLWMFIPKHRWYQ